MARNDSLATMTVKIAANTAQFNAAVKQTQGQLKAFGDSVTTAAKTFVAGFGAMQVANFALEVSKLAGEAEGVRVAFEKLPNSVRLMQQLKDATGGTVSELELMKRAVQANNFEIDLAALPKLLEFAAIRAQQTGVSVDYLVDSIVTGIGRKSPLILDNLGISTTRLKEKFGGAALEAQNIGDVARAVGEIAEEELGKMGSLSDNTSTKIQRLGAEWDNLKVAIGGAGNNLGLFDASINALTGDVKRLTDQINLGFRGAIVEAFPFLEKLLGRVKTETEKAAEAQQKQNNITETASVLLKDLGLDYQALMNVAGDNVDVMEIWAEMQRLVNQETANSAPFIDEKTKSIEKNTKAIKDNSDAEREARIATLDRSRRQGPLTLSEFTNVGEINVEGNPIANVQNAITEATNKANEAQQEQIGIIMQQREAWGSLGKAMGDTIAQTIASGEPLLRSLSKITASVINQLEQIALARMIADSSKFGLAGILAAAAGFGIVKGLFNKLGRDNSTSTYSNNSYGYNSSASGYGMSTVRVYQRGSDMQGTLNENSRLSKRTKG